MPTEAPIDARKAAVRTAAKRWADSYSSPGRLSAVPSGPPSEYLSRSVSGAAGAARTSRSPGTSTSWTRNGSAASPTWSEPSPATTVPCARTRPAPATAPTSTGTYSQALIRPANSTPTRATTTFICGDGYASGASLTASPGRGRVLTTAGPPPLDPWNAPWPGSPAAAASTDATDAQPTTSSPSRASPAPSSATADSLPDSPACHRHEWICVSSPRQAVPQRTPKDRILGAAPAQAGSAGSGRLQDDAGLPRPIDHR